MESKIYKVTTNSLETGPLKATIYVTTRFKEGPFDGQLGSEFIADFETEEKANEICAILNQSLRQQPGPRWVKASSLRIEYGKNYYASWLDGNVKTTGWFRESDGTFFWNVLGYIPITKDEYEHLSILDESAAGREEDDVEGIEAVRFAEWVRSIYQPDEFSLWSDHTGNQYTTAELYELFKQQKEK